MGALYRIGAPAPAEQTTRPTHGLARAALLMAATQAGLTRAADGASFSALLERARRAGDPPRGAGAVPRVDQTDPREYDSPEQARVWGPATCSAASLTAVLRARGVPVRVADVLRAMPGAITPQQGLVSRPGLVAAAHRFGLTARDDVASYAALQQATATGQPVLVDVTNARFPEGHWVVVTAADDHGLTITDSSGYRLTSLTREEFLAAWSGKGIRLGGAPPRPAAPLGMLGG